MSQPWDHTDLATAVPPPGRPGGRRGVARRRAAAAATAAGVAVLGIPFGLVWVALAPDVPLVATRRGLVYAEGQPEQLVAADGWYALLALPFGVLLAVGVWLLARRLRGLVGLAVLVLGAVGAGLVAWWLGRQVGLTGYETALAAAEPGTALDRPADLTVAEVGWWPPRVLGLPLVPALAATVTYTLIAAWSRFPTLRPEPVPPPTAPPPTVPPPTVPQSTTSEPTGPAVGTPQRRTGTHRGRGPTSC